MDKSLKYNGDGQKLYSAVRASPMLIKDVYTEMGISKGTLYNYYEESILDNGVKGAAASALGLSVEQIFGQKPKEPETPDNTAIQTNEGEIKGIVMHSNPDKKVSGTSNAVPYYDLEFTAGDGLTVADDSKPAYIMQIPGFKGCIAFNVYGDSMDSKLSSGTVVFGKKIEGWRDHLEYGQIYGIIMKDERRYLKYIRRSKQDETHFLLRSENQKYDDFEIPKEQIHNIWLIEGWMLKTA